jgi:hypothetical protein
MISAKYEKQTNKKTIAIRKNCNSLSYKNSYHKSLSLSLIFCLFFLMVIKFEFRVLCFLGRYSTTWAMLPVLPQVFKNNMMTFLHCVRLD